ncbi:hypothetical protein D3C72_1932410 [compost metagenome]
MPRISASALAKPLMGVLATVAHCCSWVLSWAESLSSGSSGAFFGAGLALGRLGSGRVASLSTSPCTARPVWPASSLSLSRWRFSPSKWKSAKKLSMGCLNVS